MKLKFIETKASCPIAVIDDFFTSQEVDDIKHELSSIHLHLLETQSSRSQMDTFVATDENNIALRKSNSIFVDELFEGNRNGSKILSINRKIFVDKLLLEMLVNKSLFYRHIQNSNRDWILANFYSNDDYYKSHKDNSCFTVITFFELQKFSGGNLTFPEFDISIEPIENRCVIFPGFLQHSAEPVSNGVRVSLAHFINYI